MPSAAIITLMIDDFRPAPRPVKSLQEDTNNLKAPTPEAAAMPVAAEPEPVATVPTVVVPDFSAFSVPPVKGSWLSRLKDRWPPTKKTIVLSSAIVILLLAGGGAGLALRKSPAPVAAKPAAVKVAPKPIKPTTVASNLSGLQVDPTLNNKPVTGIMIENSEAARPQSGLSEASVVYEAIAEGGITRFLALYQDTSPGDVGPIRSVRPYYLQWALGFDAPLAHVGGSPEALNDIRAWGAKDLDQFFNSGAYHRITSRYAPHNVYTAVDTLTQLSIAKGYTASTFTPWVRKVEAASKLPTARSIDLILSGPLYNVHYDYDATTNSYKRSEGGAPHLDANGNVQISPKVIIGLVTPYGIQSDGKHSDYGTIGSGAAYVYQDGLVSIGSWHKADDKGPMTFTDAAGKPLALNAGQTWLTAVTGADKINSAP